MAEGSMPWQVGSAKGNEADDHFKYQYHPGGDKNKAPKDAPSALNSVIVPNVTLPKVSLSAVEVEFEINRMGILLITTGSSRCMISIINGAKTITRPLTRKLMPSPYGTTELIVRNEMYIDRVTLVETWGAGVETTSIKFSGR